jgi:hypothetical protein
MVGDLLVSIVLELVVCAYWSDKEVVKVGRCLIHRPHYKPILCTDLYSIRVYAIRYYSLSRVITRCHCR